MYIKNMQLDQADRVVQSMPNLSSQIQIYAATQLAETWENRKAQEVFQKYIIFTEIFIKNIFYFFSHVMLIQKYCHLAVLQNSLSPSWRIQF